MLQKEWEIQFKLVASELRSDSFRFLVSSLKNSQIEIPNVPKEKFLRALKTHSQNNQYSLFFGKLTNLKIQKNPELNNSKELSVIMIILEKIGPISLIFSNKFGHLVLEGYDNNYSYIGDAALLNILIQLIKPDSQPSNSLGKIITIYYAANSEEIIKSQKKLDLMESKEGKALVFGLSIILPVLLIIIIPRVIIDKMEGFVITLMIMATLFCLYPLFKRSIRYCPLIYVSALSSYFLIEFLIQLNILVDGINPWGIFNNMLRQNLLGLIQNQEALSNAGQGIFLGIEILQVVLPFIDIFFIALIPFTIGLFLTAIFQINKRNLISSSLIRLFFLILFTVFVVTIPLTYHALGKGTEGTLFVSIGIIEISEMFSQKFLEDLETNYQDLKMLIASAQNHLTKATNSFQQFSRNPFIAYLLPLLVPEVAGIPLEDLSKILTLTDVLNDSIEYYPNLLWAYINLEKGFNQSFLILRQSIEEFGSVGFGSSLNQDNDSLINEALRTIQLGKDNLTLIEEPLLQMIYSIQETLNYSIFDDVSRILTELQIGLPILQTTVSNSIPWINSTWKLTLVMEELYNSNLKTNLLKEAEDDYKASLEIQNIDLSVFSEDSFIPFKELVNFTQNSHQITKYLLFTAHNATYMLQMLNTTLFQIDAIDFSNSTNIISQDEEWTGISIGLQNTSNYLNLTQESLKKMNVSINNINYEIGESMVFNDLLMELSIFTDKTFDRFSIIETYFLALNSTFNAINHYSLGTNSFNDPLNEMLINQTPVDLVPAKENFTTAMYYANQTDNLLTGFSNHLLNTSVILDWRNLVKGNINDTNTNSIYMNAQRFFDLIINIENNNYLIYNSDLIEFQLLLTRTEDLNWDIFTH